MSTKLAKVMKKAQKDPNVRFFSLAHLLDEEALKRAHQGIKKDAAAGVDGITKEQYGQNLDSNTRDLHERLRAGQYRHQPIRRVNIPKGFGRKGTRPIGISCLEDKIVQAALCEVLSAVYEPVFRDCSYGFRPKRSQHDALRAINRMVQCEGIEVILEADIQAFFDSLLRPRLREMLQERVVDGSFLRLIGKCLRVGVLDGEQIEMSGEGTVQGSIISPLLGNVYLHYVLDEWFEEEVVSQLAGHARLIRFADDFVIGFSRQDDAIRVLEMLTERMAEFGLTLHPEKTRLLQFGRPKPTAKGGKGPATFDFLGFTHHWHRTRRGKWSLALKTRKTSYRRALWKIGDWCRHHRHRPRKEQHVALTRRLRGHYNYFGVNGNIQALKALQYRVIRIWFKWLRRRGQRGHRLTWERFQHYLDAYPLPVPRITVQIWARSS
jgi:group II intron reverse transcriptase/maturase